LISGVFIFNQQGNRDAASLLEPLFHRSQRVKPVQFTNLTVIFCTNAVKGSNSKQDLINHTYDGNAISDLSTQKAFVEKWESLVTLDVTHAELWKKVKEFRQNRLEFLQEWEEAGRGSRPDIYEAFCADWKHRTGSTDVDFNTLYNFSQPPRTTLLVIPSINEAIDHARQLAAGDLTSMLSPRLGLGFKPL